MIAWVVSAKACRNETYGRPLTQAIKRAPAIFRPKFLGLCSRVSSEVAAFRPVADQSKV